MIRSFPPHPNPLPPGERVGHSSPQQSWGVFWNIFINYQFNCLKSHSKIPPHLPFSKGGEIFPPLEKRGRGGFENDVLHDFKDLNDRWPIMKSKFLVLIFLSLFFFIAPSFSQPAGPKYGPEMGKMPRRGDSPCLRASELNLSPDQMKELEFIHQAYFRETQPLRTELFSKYLELKEFLTNPTIKMESIHAKNAEIIQLQSRLEEKSIYYLIKVRALLTQDQLKVWCPEQEFPPVRRMMHGRGAMPPKRPHPEERPGKE